MAKIAIIGGGFTGLVAARNLVRDGHQVTIYESAPELGGLAASFTLENTPLEKAYHHLFRTDTSILSLIEELSLHDSLVWCPSSVAIFRDRRMWSFMSPLDLLKFGSCSFMGRLRTGFAAFYLQKSKNWRKLAKVTAMSWMKKVCGESATSAIWAPLLQGKFADQADKVSMAWLWARLHVRSNSREPGQGEKLGYIDGGFVRIVRALEAELLQSGVVIHCQTPVSQIRHANGKPTLDVSGESREFDSILFTGSSRAFERLVQDDERLDSYRQQLRSIRYLGAICLVFTSTQDLGDFYWVNVNDEDVPFLVFIQHTNLVPASDYNGKHVYYIAGYYPTDSATYTMEQSALVAKWFDHLKTLFPAFDPAQVAEHHMFRFNDAQHVADVGYETRIPEYQTPLPGVFLANFSQIFPEDRGTNFAVREGHQVACSILEYFNKK